jgi:hypothetical protein
VKVPRPPGSGKVIAKAKGVHRAGESEGRRRQNAAPTNRNPVRPQARVRLQAEPKPKSCTESLAVNIAGIRVKERVSTREGLTGGDLAGSIGKAIVTTNCEKSAEAIVPGKISWTSA